MSLSNAQLRYLRTLAHGLKPVVIVGQAGVTGNLLAELEGTLNHHELVKIRLNAGDRELRDRMIGHLLERTSAELVQRIGNVAVLFRPNPQKKEPLALPRD